MLFFPTLILSRVFFYVVAAVLPAAIILRYVYHHDTVEKEPVPLLISLLLLGVLSALCSEILEPIAERILNFFIQPGTNLYTFLVAFVEVAAVEEGMKLLFLRFRTWHSPAFNYTFDGIVYAVFVSLGFAAYENIQYILHFGLSVALPRAVLSIPGHAAFAVYMGVFYGRAKQMWQRWDDTGAHWNLTFAYAAAVILHGIYDACAMNGSTSATIIFLIFVIVLDWRVMATLKREASRDRPI